LDQLAQQEIRILQQYVSDYLCDVLPCMGIHCILKCSEDISRCLGLSLRRFTNRFPMPSAHTRGVYLSSDMEHTPLVGGKAYFFF
jgi:hypothetical protein